MGDNHTFGGELRILRRQDSRNLSLADLADAIGCSVAYMSSIERGERNPPGNDKIRSLMKFLRKEDESNRMVELALKSRKSVELSLDGTSEKLTNVLLGLARRSEEGRLKDDEFLDRLAKLLDEE